MFKFVILASFIHVSHANNILTETKPSLRCYSPLCYVDEPSERGFIFMKLIPLSQQGSKHKGKYFAKVSDEDYEYLNQFSWQVRKTKTTNYVMRRYFDVHKNKKVQIQMHRVILGIIDPNIIIDHRDFDGLNCQRENIRIATRAQNNCNQRKDIGASKYIGVYWRKDEKKWIARASFNNKRYHVGSFNNEEEAAIARDKKVKELHGEFAYLNFPNL